MIRFSSPSQLSFPDFDLPSYQKLSPENRWVKLAAIVPWDRLAMAIVLSPNAPKMHGAGRPTLDLRFVIGALLVKAIENLSDERTVELIAENPYVQYFCGLSGFQTSPPCDASSLTHWRSWLSDAGAVHMATEVEYALMKLKGQVAPSDDNASASDTNSDRHDDHNAEPPQNTTDSKPTNASQQSAEPPKNQGTLILDATCFPADIAYPTDTRLLYEAAWHLDQFIDEAWKKVSQLSEAPAKRPRTRRQWLREKYLVFSRKRRHTKRNIRDMRRLLLEAVRRNLSALELLIVLAAKHGLDGCSGLHVLDQKSLQTLEVIKRLYDQQTYMHVNRTTSCENRIVSLSKYWLRPIVRGKAGKPVEFGPKTNVSLHDGIARVETFSYEAYHEGVGLIVSCERFLKRYGYYPKEVLIDQAYLSRELRAYLRERGIKHKGVKLGRPSKNPQPSELEANPHNTASRNAIEGWFGVAKRRFGLDRLMCRKEQTMTGEVFLKVMAINLMSGLRWYCSFLCRLVNEWQQLIINIVFINRVLPISAIPITDQQNP